MLATQVGNEFQWNLNVSKSFYNRRGNLENITLFGITEMWTTFNNVPLDFVKEDHLSQTIPNTYEVILFQVILEPK